MRREAAVSLRAAFEPVQRYAQTPRPLSRRQGISKFPQSAGRARVIHLVDNL